MSLKRYDSLIQYYADKYPVLNNISLANTILLEESLHDDVKIEALRKHIGKVRSNKTKEGTEPFFSINLGCYHFPFHDKAQWEATVRLIHWLGDRVTLDLNLVGDMMDMNSISRHGKGKKAKIAGLTLSEEYQEGNKELDKLNGATIRKKRYLYGNHENWYYVHMSEIDNAKLGEDVIKSPKEALKLEERGFEVFTDYVNDRFQIGNLIVTHGSYFNTHAALKHLEAFKQNVLFFHTHRMQSFTDSGRDGTITGYNGGCGVHRTSQVFNYADQATRTRWEQGLSVTFTDELGHTHVDLLHWKNERFIYMGHQFTEKGITSLFN